LEASSTSKKKTIGSEAEARPRGGLELEQEFKRMVQPRLGGILKFEQTRAHIVGQPGFRNPWQVVENCG